jgi:hypothetical protein
VGENTDRSRVALTYVYCDYKEPRTEADWLAAITRQLAEQFHPLPKEVLIFWEKNLEPWKVISNEDRISIIKFMVQHFEKTFVSIDAPV